MDAVVLALIGAGGHAKVVRDAVHLMGVSSIIVIDENRGMSVEADAPEATHFHVAIGDNETRMTRFDALRATTSLNTFTAIHPSAIIASSATIGEGCFVGAGVIVSPDASISDNVIVNTGAIVEHDSFVGSHAFVAPGAVMCGGCWLGEGALLGTSATMAPMKRVGEWSIVGAGSTVVTSIGESVVAVGVPARPVRTVKSDD